jgi:hypothetical protein
MDKWRQTISSTALRITASSTTMVAVAALVGAGHKWI